MDFGPTRKLELSIMAEASFTWIVDSPLGGLALTANADALTALDWTFLAANEGAPGHPILRQAVNELAAYFSDSRHVFTVPTTQPGSEFEQAVWREMCEIPSGETRSYGDLASATGRPARAVGGACGANAIPIIVPCHRVVGADGRMVGYSGKGGIETKTWLLRHENAMLI